MTLFRCFTRLGLSVLTVGVTTILTGCSPSAGSPEQAVSKFYGALAAGNHSEAWSMVASEQQNRVESELKRIAADKGERDTALARLNTQFGTDYSPTTLPTSGEDFFEAAMTAAIKKDSVLARYLKEAPEIKAAAIDSARQEADVEVRLGGRNGVNKVIRCVAEGGGWRVRYGP